MIDRAYEGLAKADVLSEVRFVHDYVQLIFEPYTLSLYAPLKVLVGARTLKPTDAGYHNGICLLIGQTLTSVFRAKTVQLEFTFSGGTKLLVSLRQEDANGPEVAELSRPGGPIMVEGYDH